MSNSELRIIFFGSDSFVVQVLKTLEQNFQVVAVVTAPNSPVAQYAHTKFKFFTPKKLDEDLKSLILNLQPDLFVVSSYGKIIPQSFLDLPKYGAINIHPSLLPIYRGPSPVPAAILKGDKKTGVTIMKMDAKMDHGPIITTKEISLSGQEDLPELINELFRVGCELLVNVIPDYIAGKIKPQEQDHTKATYTKLFTKEDGYFDIDNPPDPEVLDRMIRAYHPWPGVWTKWNDKIVKLLPHQIFQVEGKKPQDFKNFLNSYPDFPLKIDRLNENHSLKKLRNF